MERSALRALIVAADAELARVLERAAGTCGLATHMCERLGAAPDDAQGPDLVLAARGAGDSSWRETCQAACPAPVVVVLERADEVAQARALGAWDCLPPPHTEDAIVARLAPAVDHLVEQRAVLEALDLAGVILEITDGQGRFEHVGRAFERVTGYARSEALGRTPAELLRSPEGDPADYDRIWAQIVSGRPWSGELQSRRKDGTQFTHRAAVVPVINARGAVRRFYAVKRDTTAQVETLERYRALLESADDAILLADLPSAQFVEVNPSACRMLGYDADELCRMTGRQLCAPGQDQLIARISESLNTCRRAWHPNVRLRCKDGTEFWAELGMTAFEAPGAELYVTVIRDVSDRVERERELKSSYEELRRTQEQLVASNRLAAVGELAAGIAHEINNPSAFALLNLSQAREWLDKARQGTVGTPELDELELLLDESIEGVRRIGNIVRDIGTLSKVEEGVRSNVDMTDVIQAACRMSRNELRHLAEVEVDAQPVPPVEGEGRKLAQVLINLLVNAARALEETDAANGHIRVRTRTVEGWVEVEVEDNGPGVPEPLQDRIFESFFTTRGDHGGTGLGLSLSRDIIEEHGGRLELSSVPGEGACFRIRLPAASAKEQPESRPSSGPPPLARRPRLLVVDDDPLVLRALGRTLRRECDVVAAESGEQALETLSNDAGFDIILCDLMMPDIDGPSVYEKTRSRMPELADRFVFCSGGALTDRVRRFVEREEVTVVEKPLEPHALRRQIASKVAS